MAEMILRGNWEPEVVLGETQAEQAGDTGRVAGPVRTEVPFSQLLFELALVILGGKGNESYELFPLKNKFPLGRHCSLS